MKILTRIQSVKPLQSFTNQLLRTIAISALLFGLGACSMLPKINVPGMDRIVGEEGIFRDRKEEYLEAKSIPRTEIPAGMDSYIIDDLLVIPDLPENYSAPLPDAPRPTRLAGRSDREVIVQRMQNSSWIIADVNPSQIWPRIRDYWRQAGIPVEVENPAQGLMDTGWFVLEDNLLTRERFRVSVATGFQNNSAEIHMLHMSAPQSLPVMQQATWPAESTDPAVAYDFLLDMSGYLADVADLYQATSVSMLAGTLSSEGKASMTTTPAGNALLKLDADYDRSWAALRRALTRSNVEVLEEDSSLGVIDVNFDPKLAEEEDEEDKPGFFKRVITLNGAFSKSDATPSYPIRLQILPSGNVVEVLAVPFQRSGSSAAPSAEHAAAVNTLLILLRNTIA